MFCTMSNKHTKITRIKQKYSNDNQKARRKIIELQPQNFIYSFQVKLNKTTYLSFKHIICRFMIESDNVADNLVFAVNSLITLYQIRHFYLLAKWRPRCARWHARPHWHQRSDRSGTSVIIPILWQYPEEVGQLSREFLDQSNRAIFYALGWDFCLENLHRTERTSKNIHKYSYICIK